MDPIGQALATPLTRCGGCGHPPAPLETLRRGRCVRCYERWVRARPIGEGAACASCSNRRMEQLRHFEIGLRLNAAGGRWTILCHNCAASAERLSPAPRSLDALCERLARDRRWNDRRYDRAHRDPYAERRAYDARHERRLNLRDLFDATDFAEELVIELEADYERSSADPLIAPEDMTGIHAKPGEASPRSAPADDLFLPSAS